MHVFILTDSQQSGIPAERSQKSHGGQAWHEEIRSALHGDEAGQRRRPISQRRARNRHMARGLIRSTVVAGDRILVVVQTAEMRIVAPCLLHELELALDA